MNTFIFLHKSKQFGCAVVAEDWETARFILEKELRRLHDNRSEIDDYHASLAVPVRENKVKYFMTSTE